MLIYKILLAVAIALEIPFVPWFLKAAWPKKCGKSLLLKMTCATLFVCVGLLSVKISGNCTDYAKFMIIGLLFSWLGDLLLHVLSHKKIYFLLGLISFLTGHIFYIKAYMFAIQHLNPGAKFLTSFEFIAVLVIIAGAVLCALIKKIHFGIVVLPGFIYALTLTIMFVKAITLGKTMVLNDVPNAVLALIMLAVGAFMFVLSDASLAYINFSGREKKYSVKVFNIVTYFMAQILLGSSILVVAN